MLSAHLMAQKWLCRARIHRLQNAQAMGRSWLRHS